MSILDNPLTSLFQTKEEAGAFFKSVDLATGEALGELAKDLNPVEAAFLEALRKGVTPTQYLNISAQERGAMLAQAQHLLSLRKYKDAHELIEFVKILDPLDERTHYMSGATYQAEGKLKEAAQEYMAFLALDATNPHGYLRMGECLVAANERKEAEGMFKMALEFARQGKAGASPRLVAYAERMVEVSAHRNENETE